MTRRERFQRALDHNEPDRVPIDAGQDLHNGIHELGYRNLLSYLGEKDVVRIYDRMQHLAAVKESVLARLHVDTRYIFAQPAGDYRLQLDEDRSWLDEWGIRFRPFGLYDESIDHPLKNCTERKIKSYRMPDPKDPARFAGLRERAESLYRNTDYALIGGSPASLFYLASELVGFAEFMEKLVTEPRLIESLLDRLLDYWIVFFDGYLEMIGDRIQMVWMGDDWGTELGPIVSPKLFRQMFVGRYRQLTASIKKKRSVKVALHCCGSVLWAMEDFVDCGIDVLHPLQGDAAEMDDPVRIKKRFGEHLVFYSNMRNQSLIPRGSPDEIAADVRKKIESLAPGGGYIMSAGHNIQPDVPPENILAVYDSAFRYGRYPIGFDG